MRPFVQKFYHSMPAVLRSLAASARGYQLRRWRYGPETDRLVSEALAREHWSSEQWSAWQAERLARLLHLAAVYVPYYRGQWQAAHAASDIVKLSNWPVLEKSIVRRHTEAMVSERANWRKLFCTSTSGTTGTPLSLWHSRATIRAWYALAEARWRHWYGLSRRDRWAILGGQLVTRSADRKPPFWVWNAALNQLYMSSYHLAPDLVVHYLAALRRYGVVYLLGYTSALYALAQQALRLGCSDLRMKVVLTNAEPLYDYQRQVIGRAFQCPVRETYGLSEKVAAASECEFGRLHFWPEAGVTEVLDEDDRPVPAGEPGDLVITGLLSEEMPLVRYRCGDRITLADRGERVCECGRTLPVVERIEGRSDDVLYTADGRQIGRLDPVFKLDLPLQEAQIIQESLREVRVLCIPAEGFTSVHARRIVEEMQARMGRVDVRVEMVSAIPRTANGKFRAVVCHARLREATSAVRDVR